MSKLINGIFIIALAISCTATVFITKKLGFAVGYVSAKIKR